MSDPTTPEETTPQSEAAAETTPAQDESVPHTLTEEIEAAVASMVIEPDGIIDEGDDPSPDQETQTTEEGEAPAENGDDGGVEDPAPVTPDPEKPKVFSDLPDAVVERAIVAGIPLSEIKQYPSETLLNAMCARIEANKGTGSPKDAGESGDGKDAVEDILSTIPDLDPEEFDERIVDGFKSLKEIIRKQHESNASLQESLKELQGNRSKDWFAGKLDSVKKFTKGDAVKNASVREKFDALKAGYKATGKSVTDESVFDEAAKLVLGNDMASARQEEKKNAARGRNGQFIARVGNNNVQGKPASVEDELAAELNRVFSL